MVTGVPVSGPSRRPPSFDVFTPMQRPEQDDGGYAPAAGYPQAYPDFGDPAPEPGYVSPYDDNAPAATSPRRRLSATQGNNGAADGGDERGF